MSALKYIYLNTFTINEYRITKKLVAHGRMKPAYGYIFEKDEICVGFTGDTSLCKNVEIMAGKCSYLFCDCMFLKGNDKNQGIDNLEYLSSTYPSCKFVVSHLEDDTRKELKKKKIKNIIIP